MYEQLLTEAQALQSQTVALRREIHREPELGLDLPKTRAKVLDGLSGLGLGDLTNHKRQRAWWRHSAVAILAPTSCYVAIWMLYRCPRILGYRLHPNTPGHMHACGHDAHTSMLASAAHLLSKHKQDIRGNVLFMFQPGEEGYGGAKIMLDEGLIEAGGKPDSVFALHVAPELPSGVIACRTGPILAAADTVHGRIIGRGGHGSMPHNAADPVPDRM